MILVDHGVIERSSVILTDGTPIHTFVCRCGFASQSMSRTRLDGVWFDHINYKAMPKCWEIG